jgi:phage terminase large subunit-like protein
VFRPLFPGQVCSLGYQVVDWILENCCYGPGDLQGQFPVVIDDEMFDFYVETYRIDPVSGAKVFDEAVLSRPKGRAKTEQAGWMVCAEAFCPSVRFDHWDEDGQPVGRPVTSPLIKCLATEESQATAAFSVVAYIVNDWGKDNRPEVYNGSGGVRNYQSATAIYLPHNGEIRACTAGSASKDGGKETFVVADETHLYVLRELKAMYGTIRRNLGKRKLAEPWLLQTSTAYRPGEMSIFEETLTAWRKDELSKSVYVNHREAKGRIDIQNHDHTLAQLKYVYGAASEWMDLERIYREMLDTRSCPDEETAARYFLNRPLSGKDAWITDAVVERQSAQRANLAPEERPEPVVDGISITLGFDGSLNDDSTVLIASRMSDGFVFPIDIWAKPGGPEGNWWEVPRSDVLVTIRATFARYDVVRLYADPHEWRTDIYDLQAEFGKRVVPWPTNRELAMGVALDRLRTDLIMASVWHSGDPAVMEHFRNAYVRRKGTARLVRKEYPNSPRKIDSVVGAALAYEARADAIGDGWTDQPLKRRVRVFR